MLVTCEPSQFVELLLTIACSLCWSHLYSVVLGSFGLGRPQTQGKRPGEMAGQFWTGWRNYFRPSLGWHIWESRITLATSSESLAGDWPQLLKCMMSVGYLVSQEEIRRDLLPLKIQTCWVLGVLQCWDMPSWSMLIPWSGIYLVLWKGLQNDLKTSDGAHFPSSPCCKL